MKKIYKGVSLFLSLFTSQCRNWFIHWFIHGIHYIRYLGSMNYTCSVPGSSSILRKRKMIGWLIPYLEGKNHVPSSFQFYSIIMLLAFGLNLQESRLLNYFYILRDAINSHAYQSLHRSYQAFLCTLLCNHRFIVTCECLMSV